MARDDYQGYGWDSRQRQGGARGFFERAGDEPEFETRKPSGHYVFMENQVGRGPRGWRRPDERIYEDVCDLMMQDPDLDASDIEVRVSDGEVILEGVVEGRWAKRLAEDLAESVPGVRDVHNRLRANREVINQYPDAPYPM